MFSLRFCRRSSEVEHSLGKGKVVSPILTAGSDLIFWIGNSNIFRMASKYSANLIKLKCSVCNRVNYYTRKNKKLVERKLEYKKFCNWCRKHTVHKETKK